MAASKDLSRSVLHGSAEAADFPCAICQSRGVAEVESVKYCVDCDSNMCRNCTTSHASFPAMASHQVIDVSMAPGSRRAQKAPLPTQRCEEHHGRLLDRYCQDCDTVACDTCVSTTHRKCVNMKYVPTYAKGRSKPKDLETIKRSTDKLVKQLKQRKSSQMDNLQQLDTAEAESQGEVQDLAVRLHEYIDSLARSESDKITAEYEKKKEKVKNNIKDVDTQIVATEEVSRKMNACKGNNEAELFVYVKQGEKNQKQAKQVLHVQNVTVPTYKVNNTAETTFKDVKSFGGFQKNVIVKFNQEVDVRTANDTSDSYISGICLLPDASLVIADFFKKCVKRLDPSYRVTSCLPMPAFDVCYISDNEVAVTQFSEKKVQLIKVGGMKIKQTRSFSVGDICGGICYLDRQLFVCCGDEKDFKGGNVRVFNLSGSLLHTFQYDLLGRPMFSVIQYIIASPNKDTLYVTDINKGIVAINRFGNLLEMHTSPKLQEARGFCALENGDLMICGFGSNNLLHLSMTDIKMSEKVYGPDGIKEPQTIHFDCVRSRLIVSVSRCNAIKIYDLHME